MDEKRAAWLFPAALALAAAIPLLVAAWHGLGRPYFTTPDADIIYTGEALRALDGRLHLYTDHPAYTYALALAAWLKALSLAGFIPAPGLAAAVAAPDIDAYAQAMVQGGRLLSAVLASGFVVAATLLLRLGGIGRLMAALFALMLACSGGVAIQAVILRAEMASASCLFLSFAALAIAARRSGWAGPAWLGLAGFLAMLALEAKVQALIPLLAFPVLALGLEAIRGPRPPARGDWRVMALPLVAAAFALPVLAIAWFSMRDFDFGPSIGFYQAAILVWILAGMAAFTRLNRVPAAIALLGLAALALGMALGFDVLFLRHSHRVVDAVVNPIEHMRVFAGGLISGQSPTKALGEALVAMLRNALQPQLLPLRVTELAALAGAVMLWRRRRGQAALSSVLLVGMALAVELGFGLRGVHPWYLVYIEPWVLLALLAPGQALAGGRAGRNIALAAGGLLILWTGSRALDPGLIPVQPRHNLCLQADTYIEPELAVRFHPTCRPSP